MAGIDYTSCRICGKRLFYDGDWSAREYMVENTDNKNLTCDHCVDKMIKKIERLKKFDKRRH